MKRAVRSLTTVPFPQVDQVVLRNNSVRGTTLRPFGSSKCDLELDLSDGSRPFLAIDVLRACSRDVKGDPLDERFLMDLTVGDRILCLLGIVYLTGKVSLSLLDRCPDPSCQQQIESDIRLEDIMTVQASLDRCGPVIVETERGPLWLRRPTGSDQAEWLAGRFKAEEDVIGTILRSLIMEESPAKLDLCLAVPDEVVEAIGQVMDEMDPLVDFKIQVHCPFCGEIGVLGLDLELMMLKELQGVQRTLVDTVHRLASRYHWSEDEIFSVPAWRRAQYLSRIEQDEVL